MSRNDGIGGVQQEAIWLDYQDQGEIAALQHDRLNTPHRHFG
jgi:hypothetical protein